MAVDNASISQFVKEVADRLLPFAAAMAGVGGLSMAFIQTVKELTPVRRWFQRSYFFKWAREGLPEGVSLEEAEKDLVRLATAEDSEAFYDLAIEQMCGQMNAAAQVILEYPERHKDLLSLLCSQARKDDIETLLGLSKPLKRKLQTPRDTALTDSEQEETQKYRDARTRLGHHMQRSIDAFQISASFRWKFLLQIMGFVCSALVVLAAYWWFGKTDVWAAVLTAFLAGFFAPIARDLMAALQKLRAP